MTQPKAKMTRTLTQIESTADLIMSPAFRRMTPSRRETQISIEIRRLISDHAIASRLISFAGELILSDLPIRRICDLICGAIAGQIADPISDGIKISRAGAFRILIWNRMEELDRIRTLPDPEARRAALAMICDSVIDRPDFERRSDLYAEDPALAPEIGAIAEIERALADPMGLPIESLIAEINRVSIVIINAQNAARRGAQI